MVMKGDYGYIVVCDICEELISTHNTWAEAADEGDTICEECENA